MQNCWNDLSHCWSFFAEACIRCLVFAYEILYSLGLKSWSNSCGVTNLVVIVWQRRTQDESMFMYLIVCCWARFTLRFGSKQSLFVMFS